MKKKSKNRPFFSVVIPAYNGEKFIKRSILSLQNQTFENFEVIVVDDKSNDLTLDVVSKIAESDQRIRLFSQDENRGTLATRSRGIAESSGEYILLLDQDDELKSCALEELKQTLDVNSVDILHFGVKVIPENDSAKKAAPDCEGWLTPKRRVLEGDAILETQFCENDNFDWLVHHKVFDADLASDAWSVYANESLCTSDDFLMSFILCANAKKYKAVPDLKFYVYHLGAGETFAKDYTFEKWKRICDADVEAFSLINKYADGRWKDVISNCQDKLIEHIMNEMHDNLSGSDIDVCIDYALKSWNADAVSGELWRFVRDRAYEKKNDSALKALVKRAKYADSFVRKSNNRRYLEMKRVANVHLKELETDHLKNRIVNFFNKR